MHHMSRPLARPALRLLLIAAALILPVSYTHLDVYKRQLYANPAGVPSPDIRAGMAMALAALCARGTSTIHNIQQIDRGYEAIESKLRALGANIRRIEE